MLSFRVGDLLEPLAVRAQPNETGKVCRRDLRRYYWLLALALESAPPAEEVTLRLVLARAEAALAEPTSDGDLTAALVGCLDLLPGWSALQLFALADRLESRLRTKGPLTTTADLGVRVSQGQVVRVGRGGGEGA